MVRHRSPFVTTAWTLIILLISGIWILQTLPNQSDSSSEEDSAGLITTRIQAEYLLGVSVLLDAQDEIAPQAIILDAGTVNQRQRYMAFMLALGDWEAANRASLKMKTELARAEVQLNEEQSRVQEQLDIMSSGGELPEDHESLVSHLGWFGSLLEADSQERVTIENSAEKKVMIVGSVFAIVLLLCCCGFLGLLFFFMRALIGKLRSGISPPSQSHGVYAEVFALWLFMFVILMALAGFLANKIAPDNTFVGMICTIVAFFTSLLVLNWARFRGITWKQICVDIGWTRGVGVEKECAFGLVGYAMMLPILCVGILLTLILMAFQSFGGVESDPFSGTSGGTHPIIIEIAQGGWQVRVLLLILAVVAAPIVEETMFRGVLYRQLRSASYRMGSAVSIMLSVLLTSFLFAAIHPQGWIAIPALMGIAIGMNLMREWRGTLLPSMMVHGISNGIVTSMMIIFLS